MDAGGLNQLVEYGILGLWTLSLLVSNHTMRGNFQSRYDDLNKNVVDVLKKNKETIEEILGLDVVYGERVEARPGMKKDRADAVAGAIHGVLKENSIVSGMKIMGSLDPIYTNPDVIAKENEENKNTNLYDPRKDFGAESVKARVVSSVPDTCTLCQRIGGVEYSDPAGNRLLDSSVAVIKVCIICGTKWNLINDDWKIVTPPNEESLREVAGININGHS